MHTTGQRLQRGLDLQQRFLGFTTRLEATLREYDPAMAADAFVSQLNEQIAHEFAAHQQYVAIAVHYDSETLPQLARFFYRQALEERDHAMMMVQYLIDADADVVIPGIAAPQVVFEDIVAPVSLVSRMTCRIRRDVRGSSPAVGSSRKRSSGR